MADEKTFTQADLDAAIEAAKNPLDTKNRELLAELKDARRSATITPEQLSAVEDARDKAISDLATANTSVKALTKERDSAVKALETEQGVTHKRVAENGLIKALTDNGVTDPVYLEMAKALHLGQVKIVADGDTRKAMHGEKDLDAAIKEWAATDAGKKVVSAPNNSGGGAPGGKGAGAEGAKQMTRSAFSALAQSEKAALGPAMAKGELNLVDDAA